MAPDLEFLTFQRLYKGHVLAEFKEDFKLYRTVVRTLKNYYKNPSARKLHLLYNKLVVLSRVFPESFLYHNIIITSPNLYTRNLFIYFLNELFYTNYDLDFSDEIWDDHLDELRKEGSIPRS